MIHVPDDRNTLQILEYVPITFLGEHTDAFTLRTDRKHVWLQKACLWVMKKLCANYLEPSIRYETVQIDRSKVIEAILKLRRSVDLVFKHEATSVFIGDEDYCEMLRASRGAFPHPPFTFNAEYMRATTQSDDFGRYFRGHLPCGLKVFVIPWMKGVLVI